MTHLERLLKASALVKQMAADIPRHPLLEISAEAMAHRAAEEALLSRAHELWLTAAEASSLGVDDSA